MWEQTACILCSINCGIEVKLDGRRFARVRGDKSHPASKGYTCEKALRLDHYQNGRDRLTSPLRRRADGGFDEIDWDTAIAEIADRLGAIRDEHGGASIFYYGGGGQGNHLGGGYGRATRAALGSVYSSNALAQEKTGEFWVDGQLFGRPRCHTTGDFERAQVAVFWGKNPWQSHGFPRARVTLKEIAKDPERSLVVVDPRRTETADLADVHLQVRPGGDAHLLGALLAAMVEEDLLADEWLAEHAVGLDELLGHLALVDIAEWSARAGLTEEEVRSAARLLAGAESVSIFEDLGIQQAPHSTLNSYLEKLLYLLTGNFGRPGGMNIHTAFASLGGGGGGGGRARTTPVTGEPIITGLVPCNVIPDEILTDHPDRFRAMFVESANPVHSLADSPRMREALDALDCVVVIDVAMTETAELADYVLPAASQFEKYEAAFFTLEFPDNDIQLRRPVLDPLPGTLTEPEIHTRLVRALGALDGIDLDGLRRAAAEGREVFATAFLEASADPMVARLAPIVLRETLGPTLPDGAQDAAAMWGLAQMCFLGAPDSVRAAGYDSGDELFDALLAHPEGIVFSRDDYPATFERLEHGDDRIHLAVESLLAEFDELVDEDPRRVDPEWPLVLSAGERRSGTANTIYRDPAWRRKAGDVALRIHPDDAAANGLVDGAVARVVTHRGSAVVGVELSDTLQQGHISLPNGLGLSYPGDDGEPVVSGVAPNELTSSADRDRHAGTPHHKHVRARVEAVA